MWMEESRSGVVRAPFTAASLALMPMSERADDVINGSSCEHT